MATQVKALYTFAATQQGDLSFKVGDIITLLKKINPEWWEGELNGRRGIFPSNYVQEVQHTSQKPLPTPPSQAPQSNVFQASNYPPQPQYTPPSQATASTQQTQHAPAQQPQSTSYSKPPAQAAHQSQPQTANRGPPTQAAFHTGPPTQAAFHSGPPTQAAFHTNQPGAVGYSTTPQGQAPPLPPKSTHQVPEQNSDPDGTRWAIAGGLRAPLGYVASAPKESKPMEDFGVIKVLFLGDPGVGKSAVINNICKFQPFSDAYSPNNPNEIAMYTYPTTFGGGYVTLEMYENNQITHNDRPRTEFIRGIDIVILCFSLADRNSFEIARNHWWEHFKQHGVGSHHVVLLVGTKSDITDQMSTNPANLPGLVQLRKDAHEFQKLLKAEKFVETSAKTNYNIDMVQSAAIRIKLERDKKSRDKAQKAEKMKSAIKGLPGVLTGSDAKPQPQYQPKK